MVCPAVCAVPWTDLMRTTVTVLLFAEADPHKRALLAFPGVVQKAAKPAARASTPGPTGQQGEGQAAAAAVQQQQQPGDA